MDTIIAFVVDLASRVGCSLGRHTWQYEPAQILNGTVYGPYKTCTHCMKSHVVLPELPTGHPDATAITFTPEQLDVLAELDKSFTEETR
jgi:hypothetical protein